VVHERGASARPARVYARGSEEFARALGFSDGLFAIAMTLLVVSISVPTLRVAGDEGELLRALDDLTSNFVSFFISFAVIGRYWVAHHQMFSLLRSIDVRLLGLNLVYMAFVAFLPFPTALLGAYFENAIAVAAYAVTVALVSGMEVVLFRYAHGAGLLRVTVGADALRWGTTVSLAPVLFFLASIPVAFLSSKLAVAVWILNAPFGALMQRRRPAGADAVGI
jgi:uncharacterized membrane protein